MDTEEAATPTAAAKGDEPAGDAAAAPAGASANGAGSGPSANGAPEEPASCRVDNPARVVPAQARPTPPPS